MRLIKVTLEKIPENIRLFSWMNLANALALTMILLLVNLASTQAESDDLLDLRIILLYIIFVALFTLSHRYILFTASKDAERLIYKIRRELFEKIRKADLISVEKIGMPRIQSILNGDTLIFSQIIPVLAIGLSQAIQLIFLGLYLAWLSPWAFFLAVLILALISIERVKRTTHLRNKLKDVALTQTSVFDGLTDLINGSKEIRMDSKLATELMNSVIYDSNLYRIKNSDIKKNWGSNYAIIEAFFYCLAGIVVFIFPLFITNFHEIIFPVTIAILFISGPVSTITFITPMLAHSELALLNIESLETELEKSTTEKQDEPSQQFEHLSSIGLDQAKTTYKDQNGDDAFDVGPITCNFEAGSITFISGANGSGKSTLVRMLLGFMPLDSGVITVNGSPLQASDLQKYRNSISVIFSDFHLSKELYGLKNSDYGLADLWIDRLGLKDKVSIRDGKFSTIKLSSGQRKRLALIAAYLENKEVIILDEWAADQDPHFRKIFYEVLLPELRSLNKIVIAITHDERWYQYSDSVLVMREGMLDLT
jgi:putative ATP-binding cassette transporter